MVAVMGTCVTDSLEPSHQGLRINKIFGAPHGYEIYLIAYHLSVSNNESTNCFLSKI